MANQVTTADANARKVLDGKMPFLSLDFNTAQGRESALRCLENEKLLSRQLNPNYPEHREVLKAWITEDYANLEFLSAAQRHKDLVDVYLEHKFNEQKQKLSKDKDPLVDNVSIIHSYSNQQLICYNYITREGGAVSYFDGVLGVPVKLKTKATFKIKLIDALRLVERIDVELKRVDLSLTVNFINNKITDCLRATLLGIIDGKKITYYDLPRYFGLIKDQLFVNLQKIFNSCGLAVADIEINDISITNNASEKLESQYFALAEIARVKEFENRMEEASLRFYEKKAMIHEKYPSFKLGLTEAEKDLALNRYLKRVGKEKEIVADIKEEKLAERLEVKEFVKEPVLKMEEPKPPVPNKKCLTAYITAVVLWVVASVVLTVIAATRVAGFVVLGVGAALLIVFGIALRYELKHGVRKSVQEDYAKRLEEYHKRKAEYELGSSGEGNVLEDLTIQ